MRYLILRHEVEAERKLLFTFIGEYFASAQLRREFGRPMSSDNNYIWFLVAQTEQFLRVDSDDIIAFAALHMRKSRAELCHAYTLPTYRNQGINYQLVLKRLEYADGEDIKKVFTIMKPARAPKYLPLGFIENGQRGQYRIYVRQK